MTGVLVVSHGALAEHLVNAVGMIMGRAPLLKAVGLRNDQNLDDFSRDIMTAWTSLEEEGARNVLILVDMFGGSCSNVAVRLIKDKDPARVSVITGANLPMVLEAIIDRDLYGMEDLVKKIIDSGRKSIVDIAAVLAEKTR